MMLTSVSDTFVALIGFDNVGLSNVFSYKSESDDLNPYRKILNLRYKFGMLLRRMLVYILIFVDLSEDTRYLDHFSSDPKSA